MSDDQAAVRNPLLLTDLLSLQKNASSFAAVLQQLEIRYTRWSLQCGSFDPFNPDGCEGVLSQDFQDTYRLAVGTAVHVSGVQSIVVRNDGSEVWLVSLEDVIVESVMA